MDGTWNGFVLNLFVYTLSYPIPVWNKNLIWFGNKKNIERNFFPPYCVVFCLSTDRAPTPAWRHPRGATGQEHAEYSMGGRRPCPSLSCGLWLGRLLAANRRDGADVYRSVRPSALFFSFHLLWTWNTACVCPSARERPRDPLTIIYFVLTPYRFRVLGFSHLSVQAP